MVVEGGVKACKGTSLSSGASSWCFGQTSRENRNFRSPVMG